MAIPEQQASFVAIPLGIGERSPEPGERGKPRLLTADEFDTFVPRHSRILRAAIAMRGGVSLAVWIGGAAAEMDLWRRIRICAAPDGTPFAVILPPSPSEASLDLPWLDRAELYARLLDSRGFDAVEFDVMAGASAGGLNAVMYATAQRAGADVDALFPVWRDLGSAWRLLRPPGFERVDSVFRGDGYFWPELKRVLRDLYVGTDGPNDRAHDGTTSGGGNSSPSCERRGIHPGHRATRITVDLSATVVDSEDASERGTQEGNGHFHFVGSDDGTASEHGRGIPSGAKPVADADLARLAYAARTTSSFPGAFEPALIFSKSTRVPLTGPLVADAESVDMTFAFHAHRDDWSHPFRVVDGGVLDNVPIDRAFRAIRGMASTVHATRALLYLDPSPPMRAPGSVRPTEYGRTDPDSMFARPHRVRERLADRQSQFLSAIAAGTGKRGTRESGPDEEDEVEKFRLALKQASGRSEALAVLSSAAVEDYDMDAAHRAYVRFRATADLRTVSLVMANPSLWQLGTNLPTRSIWRARSAEERSGLDHLFETVYDDMSSGSNSSEFFRAIVTGPQALLDAALSVLNWVRTLESVADPVGSVADVRRQVYAILARATDVRDECLRAVLDDAERLDAASASPTRLADTVLTAWVRENAAAIDRVGPFWDVFDGCLRALRAASPLPTDDSSSSSGTGTGTDTDAGRAWAQVPWSGVPARRSDFTSYDLAPFLAAMGIPEPMSGLAFWRITGDEAASRPDEYSALLEQKTRTATRIALSLATTDVDDEVLARLFGTGLTSTDKLAGVAAFSFGGFLSKAWRANDWWWGRLDAGAGVTRFLDSYPPVLPTTETAPPEARSTTLDHPRSSATPGRPVAQLVEEVQSSILADAARSLNPPFPGPLDEDPSTGQIRAAFTSGGNSLRDLSPRYLLSILSRSIRVASRALAGSTSTSVRLLLALLRPLLVFVPLAATPVRAAIAATVLGLTITVAASSTSVDVGRPDAWTIVPGLAVIAAILGGLGSGLVVAVRRWRRLTSMLTTSTAEWRSRALHSAVRLRRDATWQSALGTVVSCTTLGIAVWPLFRDGLSVSFWILALSGAIIAVLTRIWAQAPSGGAHPLRIFVGGTLAYALWIAIVLVLPRLVAGVTTGRAPTGVRFGLSVGDQLVAVTVTLAGLLLALLLTVGWLPVRWSIPRTWLLNAFSVSAVSAIGAGAVVVLSMLLRGTEFASLNIATTVVLAIFVWGSLLWWLPEIPEGRSPAWISAEVPDDLRN